MIVKPLYKSRTTQNVAAGAAVGGGGVLAFLTWLRGVWPSMPGDAATDASVAAVLMTIVVPAISRWLARARGQV